MAVAREAIEARKKKLTGGLRPFPWSDRIAQLGSTFTSPTTYLPLSLASTSERSSTANAHVVEIPWLIAAIDIGPNNYDVSNLSEAIGHLDRLMAERRFDELCSAVEMLPFDCLSPHLIVTVIRVMAPARFQISRWTAILDRVRENLAGRGIDPNGPLRGLI
jgi:hypothetical protein